MKVLLIIDLQRDFCPGGSLAVPEGDSIVPIVNELLASKEFDARIATKDWHPSDHVSYVRSHPGKAVFELIDVPGGKQVMWPVHCEQGTPGAEFHEALKAELIDITIQKGTDPGIDSYSGLFDNQKKRETELRGVLQRLAEAAGEKLEDVELTVCGLATDYCVKFTVLDARELNFKTRVVVDACRAVNLAPNDERDALRAMAAAGAELVQARDILPERAVAVPARQQEIER